MKRSSSRSCCRSASARRRVREMAQNSVFFFRAPAAYDEKAVRKHVTADVSALLAEAAEASWSACKTGLRRPFMS